MQLLLCLIFSLLGSALCDWQTLFFTQPVDHFNLRDLRTFSERYKILPDYYTPGGPIFFCTGNEGAIDGLLFEANLGLQLDIAPDFHALVVVAEHRYYGDSLPFGNSSWDPDKIGYLTSEQALADFYQLIAYALRSAYPNAGKLITFGGSYGGMLSAWMRMHYPNWVAGAIASSAPLNLFQSTYAWTNATSQTYLAIPNCGTTIRTVFNTFYTQLLTNNTFREAVQSNLNLCYPVTAYNYTELFSLLSYMENAFISVAQFGYPYPLLVDIANPVPSVCRAFATSDMYKAMQYTMGLWFNSSRTPRTCFDYLNFNVENITGVETTSWSYQTCTEIFFGAASNGVTDIFYPLAYDLDTLYEQCVGIYNIRTPSVNWTMEQIGGPGVGWATNILFTVGGNDPTRAFAPTGPADIVFIEGGGHCIDLYPFSLLGSIPYPSLRAARVQQIAHIKRWVAT